jgi:hypothetical protein
MLGNTEMSALGKKRARRSATAGAQTGRGGCQAQPVLKGPLLTGYSRNAIVHQGRLDPGVELIQKPLTSEQLAIALRKVLDGNLP